MLGSFSHGAESSLKRHETLCELRCTIYIYILTVDHVSRDVVIPAKAEVCRCKK